MKEIAQRLKKARKATGLSQMEVAEKLNIRQGTISDWERNRTEPDFEKLSRLMEFYNLQPNDLFDVNVSSKSQPEKPVMQDQAHLEKRFEDLGPVEPWTLRVAEVAEKLNEDNRRLLEHFLFGLQFSQPHDFDLDALAGLHQANRQASSFALSPFAMSINPFEPPRNDEKSQAIMLKFYLPAGSSPTGNYLNAFQSGTMAVIHDQNSRKADFIYQVDGQAMEPWLSDCEMVLVEQADTIRDGDVGLFEIDGRCYIRIKNGRFLSARNSDYEDIPIRSNMITHGRILGKARSAGLEKKKSA